MHAPQRMEWPTVVVAVAVWGGWIAMLVWHESLPWPAVLLGFALLGGWYMSFQHEVLHGHPTPWTWLNTARDRSLQVMWAVHVVASVAVGWLVFAVAGVPVWQYLVGYVWFGLSVSYVRSFAEHLAVAEPLIRSAFVRSNPVVSVLFMNVNLHHTHHALPSAAWYRLGRLSEELGAAEIAAAGAESYRGYWQIARRYAVRPFSQPAHPLADRMTS